MAQVWIYSIISVTIVSLVSLVGALALLLQKELLNRLLLFLVSFSAGALLGSAFIHLLPEAVEIFSDDIQLPLFILSGILLFFILEKLICWRHCHIPTSEDHPHPLAFMNLIGDGFHNFIDGMVIAGSYLINIPLGLITTIAVIIHEIPQEIGDFGVLIYGGFSKLKAVIFNLLSAFIALGGVVFAIFLGEKGEIFSQFLIPFTVGGFIYIAASDLIPELRKETKIQKSFFQFLFLLAGILVMALLLFLE